MVFEAFILDWGQKKEAKNSLLLCNMTEHLEVSRALR